MHSLLHSRRFTFAYNVVKLQWCGPANDDDLKKLFDKMFACSLEISPAELEVADDATVASMYHRMARHSATC